MKGYRKHLMATSPLAGGSRQILAYPNALHVLALLRFIDNLSRLQPCLDFCLFCQRIRSLAASPTPVRGACAADGGNPEEYFGFFLFATCLVPWTDHHPPKQSLEDGPQKWQAGADDSTLAFYHRHHQRYANKNCVLASVCPRFAHSATQQAVTTQVLTRNVRIPSLLDQFNYEDQPDAAHERSASARSQSVESFSDPIQPGPRLAYLQQTQQEDGCYRELLSQCHGQPKDLIDGQKQDGQVKCDIWDGVGQRQLGSIETGARHRLVPDFFHGLTLKTCNDGAGEEPGQRDNTQRDTASSDHHESLGEDAPIHGQDGELGEDQQSEIDQLHRPQCLYSLAGQS